MLILNGRLNGDKDGNFTCKDRSVVVYCISNVYFLSQFHCLKVLEFSNLLSDGHCPLSTTLHGNALLDDSFRNTSEHLQENVEKVKNWDREKLFHFQKNINQERINNLIIELSRPGDDMTSGSVNSIVENIGEIFVDSAKITFGTFCPKKSRPRQKKSEDKPWLNVECKLGRQNYRKRRRKYKKNRSEKNQSRIK